MIFHIYTLDFFIRLMLGGVNEEQIIIHLVFSQAYSNSYKCAIQSISMSGLVFIILSIHAHAVDVTQPGKAALLSQKTQHLSWALLFELCTHNQWSTFITCTLDTSIFV